MEQEVKSEGLSFMVVKMENQKVPEFKEIKGKEWILWDDKHKYPDYLIDLYLRSSTHNAIITGKVDYILGEGWTADKTGLSINDQAILNSFISKVNPNQTLNELSEPVTTDFELFNAIALQVIWNKAKTDFELHHVPFNKLTPNKEETKYFFSNDWSESIQSEEKTGLKEYPAFDFNSKEKKNGIYVFKIKAPKKGKSPNVYPTPGYIGSTQSIETELECANYSLCEIKTGFSGGTMITFLNGEPPPEKKEEIEKLIKKKFSGTDRAGSIIVAFADGKERGSQVDSLQGNDLPERYMEVKKSASQDIFTGHKVSSPMLFGVKTEGQLGGRNEIAEAYELFQNTYISKRQRIIEKIFNRFAALKGLRANLKLKPTSAIGYGIPDSLIAQAMPIDFVKEKLGVPVPKEDKSSEAKSVIDAINSLSPLVANKVLESMSAAEIRSLVGLSGIMTTTVQRTETQMSKHKEIATNLIAKFATIGRPKSDYNIFKSTCLFHADSFSVAKAEQEYFAKKDKLSSLDRSIIDLISKDEKIPASELAKALKTDIKTIEGRLKDLVDSEYISPSSEGYSPTDEGIDIVEDEGAKTINVEILYSYEWRPGFNNKDLKTSREFCSDLINLDFLYTRAEIDNLSNEFGTDVWTFKGGWYTNPKTDAPTPQCRHIWFQHVVKRK